MHVAAVKKPGAKGTKNFVAEYGEKLVAVRYRYDKEKKRRYVTVEIIKKEDYWEPGTRTAAVPLTGVRCAYEETEIRKVLKLAGARWIPELKLWEMPRQKALELGLHKRLVSLPNIRKNQVTIYSNS